MLGIRYEQYKNYTNKFPFTLATGLERSRYHFSKEQNWHENLEIQLFTKGSGYVLLNGEKYDVEKDDIVVVNSNVLHYTCTDTSLTYTCLIISNEWCKQMNIDYAALAFEPRIKNREFANAILQLSCICSAPEDLLCVAKANEILLKIMINLVEQHCSSGAVVPFKTKHFETVKETIRFIQDNFQRKLSLAEISQAVFFNKYTLCKEFKRYTGRTIVEYIHHYRALKAIDFFSEGYSVGRTAELCGFENLSFFTKTFKKHIGKTPSQYCKNARL